MKILFLSGPNLNLLGLRDQALYGPLTLAEIVKNVRDLGLTKGCEIFDKQSNHEGFLIDWIHDAIKDKNAPFAVSVAGIIINAGGLTHTSVSLGDAIKEARDQGIPSIEVHLSDINKREKFRRFSYLKKFCIAQISGKGPKGYTEGLLKLIKHIKAKK